MTASSLCEPFLNVFIVDYATPTSKQET